VYSLVSALPALSSRFDTSMFGHFKGNAVLVSTDYGEISRLEAIVQAPDNNARAEALETFAESVLSFYDDLQMSRYTRSSARRQFSEVAKVFGE
jgi:hypothetical protein